MVALLAEPPRRVLAVYAHPDDADVSCGGSLAKWARDGADVQLVVCTRGDKGTTDPDVDPDVLARRRAVETDEAAAVLGLQAWHGLDHLDGELEDDRTLRSELVGWVRRVRPDTVLCPDPTAVLFGDHYVNHRDHRTVGTATLDAVAPAAARPLYFPEHGPAHQVSRVLLSGTLAPTVWVDVSTTIESKLQAVACHRSQLDGAGSWATDAVRSRAEDEGRRAGVRCAEAFRLVRLDG